MNAAQLLFFWTLDSDLKVMKKMGVSKLDKNKNELKSEIIRHCKKMRRILDAPDGKKHDELMKLLLTDYQEASIYYRHFDNLKWTLGIIVFSATFVIFGIVVKSNEISFIFIILCGVISILLMLIWFNAAVRWSYGANIRECYMRGMEKEVFKIEHGNEGGEESAIMHHTLAKKCGVKEFGHTWDIFTLFNIFIAFFASVWLMVIISMCPYDVVHVSANYCCYIILFATIFYFIYFILKYYSKSLYKI